MPPLTQAKPATYRDNVTWLEMLDSLKHSVDDIILSLNMHVAEEHNSTTDALRQLAEGWHVEFVNLRDYLEGLIEGVNEEPLIFDPTDGSLLKRVTSVMGNVYDNARIFAYFARQYDELELTCVEWEALQYSARHFDLAPTYPTLNDVLQ